MRTYEGMFLVEPVLASTQQELVVKHIRDILTKHQAKVIKISKWAERKLAYPIRKQNRATYFLVYFEAPPEEIVHLRTDCQLSEIIMRTLILALDKKKMVRSKRHTEVTSEVTEGES